MCTKHVLGLLCALAISFPVTAHAQGNANKVMRAPPELGIVVAVDRRMLEVRRFVQRTVTTRSASELPPGVKIEATVGSIVSPNARELLPAVETHVTRIDATSIAAHRIDGRTVPYAELMDELASPTPVLLARNGEGVDRIFAQLFKPQSLVLTLLPPAGSVPESSTPR